MTGVRHVIFAALRAGAQPPPSKGATKEAVLQLIKQHGAKQQGPRRGWQVKAASWVKKLEVDRGDVKVGRFGPDGFAVLPWLRPRYLVPADLDGSELKPYVAVARPKREVAAKDDRAED